MAYLTEQDLNRVCLNCGEYFGKHNAGTSACPLRDFWQPQRFIGYSGQSTFKEWEECNE